MTADPLHLLNNLQIASPCSADWNAMTGDDKRRYCGECSLHVHDLSAMTSAEALQFLAEQSRQSTRTCIRMFRRADGRVLTKDCPVGWARLRAKARAARRRLAACAALLLGSLWSCTPRHNPQPGSSQPANQPTNQPPIQGEIEPLMGDVCLPEETLGRVVVPESQPSRKRTNRPK